MSRMGVLLSLKVESLVSEFGVLILLVSGFSSRSFIRALSNSLEAVSVSKSLLVVLSSNKSFFSCWCLDFIFGGCCGMWLNVILFFEFVT